MLKYSRKDGPQVDEMLNTSLVIIALDKDDISEDDDLERRIAVNAPIYQTNEKSITGQYVIVPSDYVSTIYLQEKREISYKLYLNDTVV